MSNHKSTVAVEADGRIKRPMVGWYDPAQLMQTAAPVVISTLFGRHADFRLLEALTTQSESQIFDYSGGDVFWFDYTADVGDGWNSTYAVAYSLAQSTLSVSAEDGVEYNTERGQILIFGGDQVYPVANRTAYQEKLVDCYEAALARTPENNSPTVFAIPGNHDWYDGLASFMRLFCSGRWFGGWKTKQKTSYFAAKLPHGWWLIGTDIQLDSDIDAEQVAFLHEVAEQMQENDRLILCVAEPHWIYAKTYGIDDSDYNESNLAFIEEKIFGKKISVFLAGDLHHYRRHQSPGNVQKITAGGGGAFLHPTHGPDVEKLAGDFTLQKSFPDQKTSRRLAWHNLRFSILNPTTGIVTAVLYLLTGWGMRMNLSPYALSEIEPAFLATFNKMLNEPLAVFWILFMLLSFYLFTDTHSKRYRYIAGTMHGMSHLIAVFFLGWCSSVFTLTQLQLAVGSTAQLLASGLLMFLSGWLLGPVILGIYLLVSLNGFKHHSNEAFSSLKIEDWKNFLRMKIDVDGSLTIYAVGLRRVPRKWKKNGEPGERSCIIPNDERATKPQLIDKVILK